MTFTFIIISPLHVSGGFSAPSSGDYKTACAFLLSTAGVNGLEQFQPIHTGGRQQESMTIPKAAHTVL